MSILWKSSHLITTLLLVGGTAVASPPGFDVPLAEFSRHSGGDVHTAASGVGTADGGNSFGIATPGEVLEAWIFWSGEVRRDPGSGFVFEADPGLTLSGGALGAPLPLVGTEVARRLALPDDGDNGGEVVMKAPVPAEAFLAGNNLFSISDFNELNPSSGMSYYRRQHGVAMLVAYRGDDESASRESILLEGGDWFFKDRFAGDPDFADEIAGEVACFDFVAPLDCDQSAFLRFATGGLVEQPLSAAERTFVLSGSGPLPTSLLGGAGNLLEENTLNLGLASDGFFRGRKLAVYEGEVPLRAGDTWLCFQLEHDLALAGQIPDPYFTFFASLDLDRDPSCLGGCLTRTPGFWGTHPHVTAQYLSLDSCGLTLDSTLPKDVASATEDMCVSGQDAKEAKTSMQQLQLVRQCMAAHLNLAASAAGGGSCGSPIEARIAECCESLCNSGAKGNVISNSMCIEDIDEFNNSADTQAPYGPFLSPGPADPASCQASRGNGWVNKTDDERDRRRLGPAAGGGKDSNNSGPTKSPSRKSGSRTSKR